MREVTTRTYNSYYFRLQKYMVKRISEGAMCLSRYIVPIIFKILEAILCMCESHFKCLCIVNSRQRILF